MYLEKINEILYESPFLVQKLECINICTLLEISFLLANFVNKVIDKLQKRSITFRRNGNPLTGRKSLPHFNIANVDDHRTTMSRRSTLWFANGSP
jgi:hypothetical protein